MNFDIRTVVHVSNVTHGPFVLKKILQLLCTVYWKIVDSPLFSKLYRKIKWKSKLIVLNSPYFNVTGLGIGVGWRVEILRLPDKPTCIHSLYPLVIVLQKRVTYTTCKSFKVLDKIHDNDLLHTTWLESKTCYGQLSKVFFNAMVLR